MNKENLLWILKFCAFSIFAGRAYEHLFWDSPFRTILWNEKFLSGIVENIFNTPWKDYASSIRVDTNIQNSIKLSGVYYAICAVLSLTIKPNSNKYSKIIIGVGACMLAFLAFLLYLNKFHQIAMFFEHSIQFGTPLILLYLIKINLDFQNLILPLKIITALTFASHGLYALGLTYPLPGNFVEMTLNILPVTEDLAKNLLFTAGVLDFIIIAFIFTSIPKLQNIGLLYATFWGLTTAFARITNGLSYNFSLTIIHQYLFACIYRLAHGLIPLLTYFILKNTSPKDKTKTF